MDPFLSRASSRVPPEVLQEIFAYTAYHAGFYDVWFSSCYGRAKLPTPLTLAQVCSKWRLASRSFKPLWRNIPCFNENLTKLALKLSKPLPFDVRIGYPKFDEPARARVLDPASLKAVISEIVRIRSLCVRLRGWGIGFDDDTESALDLQLTQVLEIMGQHSTPLLEEFEVRVMRPLDQLADTLPRFFSLPRLSMTCFTLDNCPVNYIANVCCGSLTVLYLRDCGLLDSAEDFLGALASLPSLESVYLQSCFALLTPDEHFLIPARSIKLPRLAHLVIEENPQYMDSILPYLDFPLTTQLWLTLNLVFGEDLTAAEWTALLRRFLLTLSEHFSSAIPHDTFFSQLYLEDDTDIMIQATKLAEDSGTIAPDWPWKEKSNGGLRLSHSMTIEVSNGRDYDLIRGTIPIVMKSLSSLRTVQRLSIWALKPVFILPPVAGQDSSIDWDGILAPLQHVDTLCMVSKIHVQSFVCAVCSRDAASNQKIFPKLRKLQFAGDLRKYTELDWRKVSEAVRSLALCCSLRVVEIDRRYEDDVGQGMLDALREIVEVKWVTKAFLML
ncbi:hypothetical protein K488DRAFT_87796 [Vararia minispora EC-137]|uniref:Uncharacterized protein n=1 Tax=Vararia minispora EC-137 TaxID=1314806 RepID=A0ACB8QGI6_9AGAM|nr:hypothetical protein K488DRAFT_87796 [Vararia minispora EC-137]